MSPNPPARVMIIGAGPAGMSCALWLHNLGLEPGLIDSEKAPGGAMQLNFLNNNWVLGQRNMSGLEMAARFAEHIDSIGVPLLLETRPTHIALDGAGFRVTLETPEGLRSEEADAIVLATGTRYRGRELLLGLPGFARCDPGRLRYGPHCFTRLSVLASKRLLVIGGGDNALENATLALEAGARVTVATRGQFRGQARYLDRLAAAPECALHADARLTDLQSSANGLTATLEGAAGRWQIEVDRVHLLAGYAPNSGFLDATLGQGLAAPERDAAGYLVVDAQGRCSTPGFYAAGDVGNPAFPNILSALAQGAQVAKTIESDFKNASRT
ncbi:NAD(P)/FAD-dependent oxidoreductase [Uliginosibacterium paludis]|uniref:NAD(P)/FAD-dependent oxidoreductase n=1 Tax=Uliginosibacterium paludis TaxID=1615952 RepID=A0ABV2CSL5_9RHOO